MGLSGDYERATPMIRRKRYSILALRLKSHMPIKTAQTIFQKSSST